MSSDDVSMEDVEDEEEFEDEEFDEFDQDEEEGEEESEEEEEEKPSKGKSRALASTDGLKDDIMDADTTIEKPYECLTPDKIIAKQQAALEQVKPFLGDISLSSARSLLQYYRWDAMKLLNDFAEDSERVCKRVGVSLPSAGASSTATTSKASGGEMLCQICYDTVDASTITALDCGHTFCRECWNGFLSIEVKEKKKFIVCPGYHSTGKERSKCNMVVDEFTVLRLLGDGTEVAKKYREGLVASFVEDNPDVCWCPRQGCPNAIVLYEVSVDHNEAVQCDCGHRFCFRCRETEHRPCSCAMVKEWAKKNSGGDESLNEQLIATISRACPKCKVSVQKNGGCNHMSCTQCQYHFCWQCMGKFGSGPKGGTDGYSSHKCNGFFQEDSDVLAKKGELERFEFYSQRYNNHHKSMTLELKLKERADLVVSSLIDTSGMSWIAAQFYTKAVDQLVANRQTLKNSYIFGYYRPIQCAHVNKLIFENLQLDLERHTELLASLIENPEPVPLFEGQQRIINQSKVAMNVKEALVNAATHEWSGGEGSAMKRAPSRTYSSDQFGGGGGGGGRGAGGAGGRPRHGRGRHGGHREPEPEPEPQYVPPPRRPAPPAEHVAFGLTGGTDEMEDYELQMAIQASLLGDAAGGKPKKK